MLLGHDTDIKTDRLAKVKSAVKKVGAGLARGAGYVAGAAVRGVKAAGREFSKGYERGRGGSSSGSSSSSPHHHHHQHHKQVLHHQVQLKQDLRDLDFLEELDQHLSLV
jgi:hypothetical protein